MLTVNTCTSSRIHPAFFLTKRALSTDDDSPPVFHWNVKHICVILFCIKLIGSFSSLFKRSEAPRFPEFRCRLQLWVSQCGCVSKAFASRTWPQRVKWRKNRQHRVTENGKWLGRYWGLGTDHCGESMPLWLSLYVTESRALCRFRPMCVCVCKCECDCWALDSTTG